jgi:hypothetical protein
VSDLRGDYQDLAGTDSPLACIVGSSIICIDIIVRQIPGKRNFKIAESKVFLAASLSLSFGVMVGDSRLGGSVLMET